MVVACARASGVFCFCPRTSLLASADRSVTSRARFQLSVGARRHCRPGYRRCQPCGLAAKSAPAISTKNVTTSSPAIALLGLLQSLCIVSVIGIQTAQLIAQQQARSAPVQVARGASRELHVSQAPPPPAVPEPVGSTQPLLLAVALACGLLIRVFGPKQRVEVAFSGEAGARVLQQDEQIAALTARVDALQRELSKVEPRLLLCSEQVRMLKRDSEDQRAMLTVAATDHANSIAAVQEQANNLQTFVVSLEGAVSKQIKVIGPPIKALSERVCKLEAGKDGRTKGAFEGRPSGASRGVLEGKLEGGSASDLQSVGASVKSPFEVDSLDDPGLSSRPS